MDFADLQTRWDVWVLGVGRRHARARQSELGTSQLSQPRLIQGDTPRGLLRENAYDIIGYQAVFKFIPDPVSRYGIRDSARFMERQPCSFLHKQAGDKRKDFLVD